MKNILLATTALFATAGFAAAEVSLSGSAEMGIFGGSQFVGVDDDADEVVDRFVEDDIETQFHTDINVDFTLSGTSDAGLTFGAEIGLEEAEGGVETDVEDDFSVFVSGAFGTLTMGDTDGAFDRVLQEAIIGADIIDSNEHLGYNGNNGFDGEFYDGQVARYDYAFGDFNFAASLEIDDNTGDIDDVIDVDQGDPVFGIGANYTFPLFGDEHTVGLGYQTVGGLDLGVGDDASADIIGISADLNFGDIDVILNYSQANLSDEFEDALGEDYDPTHFGLAIGYTIDALTLAVNYGEYDEWVLGQNDVFLDTRGFGFIANYDLGGGLEAQFGYSVSEADDIIDDDQDGDFEDGEIEQWSLGLAMSF
ncbi:porin [Aestuariibius sp. 2305UL40-4]|uniref:porin n=1 Tax=Aestuariibius violaceus TaxID=3234132 RepID=UPI00345E1698